MERDLDALRDLGVDHVVSMLSDSEVVELALADEEEASWRSGMQFTRVPLADRSRPESALRWCRRVEPLLGRYRSGAHVAAHCRASVGRAPLFIGSLLVLDGAQPDEVWRVLEMARGRPVPDTDAQRDFLDEVAAAAKLM